MGMTSQQLDLSPMEIDAYLEALLAVVTADGVLSTEEIIRIYQLFSLLSIKPEERRRVMKELVIQPEKFKSQKLNGLILTNDTLRMSLAKDLALLEEKANDNSSRKVAKGFLESISLTAEQKDVIRDFISVENQILKALGAGNEWIGDENSWKELVSRSAAVGVPLAALNMAGVAGFSAAGITSGLATLGGMSGLAVLGLNPMTAGIGALILGGVAVKKVADFVLTTDDNEEDSQIASYRKARKEALNAIASDLPVVTKGRKRDFIRFRIRKRRRVLRENMNEAIILLHS